MKKSQAIKYIESLAGCGVYDSRKRNMIIFRCEAANGNKVSVSGVRNEYSVERIEEAINYAIECKDF